MTAARLSGRSALPAAPLHTHTTLPTRCARDHPRRTSATVVSGLESMAFAANRQYVSAVAFRGIYVTDPVYVDVLQTNPDATVSGRGVVNSLSFNGGCCSALT